MKRYLGIVCLLYSGIFGYVVLFDKLKNFLAPSMQIYLKLSIIPLLVIGIIMLTNKSHYKFKVIDLVLLIPLVFLVLAGDGRLTSSFASNRSGKFNASDRVKNTDLKEKNDVEEKVVDEYDFSNPYFQINDTNYIDLAYYFAEAPKASKFMGKTIKVKGFALKDLEFMDSNYFAVGKYEISCCAADASYIGYIAKYDISKISPDKWYEIEGVLDIGKDKEGYDIVYINVINLKEISSEEQYVYPCYSYGENACKELEKYNLEY